MSERKITRRRFVQSATLAGAVGPYFLAGAVQGESGRPGPNGRIHVGLIGCGGMGRANLANCAAYDDVVVTAACDVWQSRLDEVLAEYPEATGYRDYREMLEAPDLDAVIIATPPHWHALQAVAACEAKKDVYLQKPMTLHVGESLAVRNAVREHGVICQIGTQIHAGENYRRVVEFIRSGKLGAVGTVRTFNVLNQGPDGIGREGSEAPPEGLDWEMWCGPAPHIDFHPRLAQDGYYHNSWMDYSGGWTPGMAPHIVDLPVWTLELGYPTATSCAAGRYIINDDGDAYDNQEVLWQYPGLAMTWMCSLTNSYGFDLHSGSEPSRRLGIYFHGTDGTLYANYGEHEVIPEGERMTDADPPEPSLASSPGHEREWLDCIKSREQPSCAADYHVKVDVPIALANLASRLGRTVHFDPATEWIVGDSEAEQAAVPDYREPWAFPSEYLG